MQEIISLVLRQVRSIWRFRWIALAIAWIIAVVGWLYVYSLPAQYRSSARVHIDTKSAIHPLLRGMAVSPDSDQQVNLLIHTVLSRPHLRDIMRSTGLDLKATSPKREQSLLDGLQKRIALSNAGNKTDLYTISYVSSNPQLAQSVVQQVMSIMTTMNLSNNQGDNTAQAVSFLSKEVDKYKKDLNDTEQKLAQFKKEHAELMPGANDYVDQVQQYRASIESTQDELAAARERVANVQQQMRSGGGGGRVSPSRSQQIQRIDAQLDNQRQQLSQLLMKYTPKHPDVVDTKGRISDLEERRQKTLARLRAHPGQIESPNSVSSNSSGGSGPSSRLNDAKAHVASLQSSLKRKRAKLAKLQSGAGSMNGVQAQLAELSRNYEVTRDQYQKLVSRLYSARLSSDVQSNAKALDFRVIDPPQVPAQPSGPRRVILLVMGLLGAVIVGVAFAWFLGQIRPVFSSRRDLTEATGYPVIGSVSLALSPAQRAGRRRSLLVFSACAVSLLLGFVAALALLPIGVQWVPNIVSGQML